MLPLTTFYLQMWEPPYGGEGAETRPWPIPPMQIHLLHAQPPPISFYRYLYNTVGDAYEWYDRRRLSDAQLAHIIHDPLVEVHVLYVRGVPAGYAELDRRQTATQEIELAYFGLMPEFVGQGYGLTFLQWAVQKAWSYQPQRVWVHTCSLDHPNALGVYQKAGFVLYKEEVA
jgi:GNAT superfamily N-acetyltransferase